MDKLPPIPRRNRTAKLVITVVILGYITASVMVMLVPYCSVPSASTWRNGEQRELAVNNMKALYAELERFRAEFGSYPCDATAELLAARQPGRSVDTLRGESANSYLRQLFCMATPADERHFYARLVGPQGKESTRVGDNRLQEKALELGENAMGYVMRRGEQGRRETVQAGGEPTPLLICALCPNDRPYAAHKLWLDNDSFRGHVFVLYTDGSVRDHADDCLEDERDYSVSYAARSFFPTGGEGARQHIVLPPCCRCPEPLSRTRAAATATRARGIGTRASFSCGAST